MIYVEVSNNVLQCKEWICSRLFCSLMGSSLGDDISSAVAVGEIQNSNCEG